MSKFLYIWEYLEVTSEVLFRKDINEPIMSEISQMNENNLNALLVNAQRINKFND